MGSPGHSLWLLNAQHLATIYTHSVDAYLVPDYAAIFVLNLTRVRHLEGKLNKSHLGLYQVINQ